MLKPSQSLTGYSFFCVFVLAMDKLESIICSSLISYSVT